MSLDDRLRSIDFYNPGVTRYLRLSDEDIKTIKQAFIAEGWQKPNEFGQVAYTTQLVDGVVSLVPRQVNVMTGQEWLDRFADELGQLEGGTGYDLLLLTQVVIPAARRAAGLDR